MFRIGRRSGHEVRPVWSPDQQPSERLERDVLASAELAEQIRHPSIRQEGGNITEQPGRRLAELLRDEVVNGQADHHVTVITVTDHLADRHRQKRITKQRGRTLAKSQSRVARSIASERNKIPAHQNAEKIGGDSVTGQIEDLLGVRIPISRDPRKVWRHGFIIAATSACGQAHGTSAAARALRR